MPSAKSRTTVATSQRRTMKKIMTTGVPAGMVANLLLAVVCLSGALSGAGMVSASALPSASFPSNSNGVPNSASADIGHRRTSCVAVHPILKQRGVDPIDMPIDPIPGRAGRAGRHSGTGNGGGVHIPNVFRRWQHACTSIPVRRSCLTFILSPGSRVLLESTLRHIQRTQFHEHVEPVAWEARLKPGKRRAADFH
uniref:Uncharacterized protein n=1 Tax=Anopheles maculatus TaxID=74869 RepID=A0A182S8U0_9DIPT